jgi:hypothetical protein
LRDGAGDPAAAPDHQNGLVFQRRHLFSLSTVSSEFRQTPEWRIAATP